MPPDPNVPADVAPVQIEVVGLDPPKSGYKITFSPDPQDPQPAIYYTEPPKPRGADKPRRVRWKLIGTLPPDHYLVITPKAYNSGIFHPLNAKADKEREKHRLDNAHPEAYSNEPQRGPKLNLGLAWYYGVHLYKQGEASVLTSFPPRVADAEEGQEIAYLDPVVVIKDE